MKRANNQLKQYRAKRKLEETPEPKGKIFSRKKGTLQFVIQKHAARKKKPSFMQPMLATLVDEPFDHKDWLFEIKWDGFRAIAALDQQNVRIYSRNQLAFNDRFPQIVKALESLKCDAIFDGEIVALDRKGISHFQMLQNSESEQNIYYYVFDILYLNGQDVRHLPLIERKLLLKGLLEQQNGIRYSEHIEEQGKKFFKLCQKQGLEGVIGKQKTSVYESGQRSKSWVKIKAELKQEVVICGFTQPRKSRKHLGALIIGIYKKGVLEFAGHVGGGFTEKKLEEVKNLLAPLVIPQSPFKKASKTNTQVTWVKPIYLCEVKFKEWTSEGIMRMPIFLGIRMDKPPKVIRQEKPTRAKAIVKQEEYNFITNREKLFWENEKITKGDLLFYYESIASYILPYLIDRPESLRRYPNGFDRPSFFQKNVTSYPDWLETIQIRHTDKEINYMLIQNVRSLLYAVNLGCIEIHPWFSRIQSLENPDFLMFDLDPVDIDFDAVVQTAQAIHALLNAIQLPSYCKTSGGRGLHIGVPLNGQYSYEQAKQFALLIATLIRNQIPDITSLERSPKDRRQKVYIDCFQNNFGQTLAAPYSVRAKPGAPVSTPLAWSEVKKGLNPSHYHLFNTLSRLKKKGDLILPLLKKGANLKKALQLLQKLTQS